ncbi:MAG: NTP transferase domain-containing protein [Patescibacteria group bacterium]|nr:NTP transferase domain-containing protein [Patescibacteria group bacterium]
MNGIGAVILAAGRGSRMKSRKKNKVVLSLGNKPMILHTVELLERSNIKPIIAVVGFARQSVMDAVNGKDIIFVYQRKRLGTGHALLCALRKLPSFLRDIVVLQGDDSALYTTDVIKKLVELHKMSNASITLLTVKLKDPTGLGRVIRDNKGKIRAIVEEKDATALQKKINEINPACYVFKVDFLRKYLRKIKKNKITGEYYLVDLVYLAISNNKRVESVKKKLPWRGVNTKEELVQAEELFAKHKKPI